jgi:hypothetical protein
LDALFLFIEGFDAHFEAFLGVREVLLSVVVLALDEQLADLAVHRRVLVHVVQGVEGGFDLVQSALGLLFLRGDLLSGLLEVL